MNNNSIEDVVKKVIEEMGVERTIEEYRVNFIVEPLKGLTGGKRKVRISLGPFFETGVMSKALKNLLASTAIGVINRTSGIPYSNPASFIYQIILYDEKVDKERTKIKIDKKEVENSVDELLDYLVKFVDAFSKTIQDNIEP
jgi:hypothetical protein